jgi:hypothetical protein
MAHQPTTPSATSPDYLGGWLLSGGTLPQRHVNRLGATWNESLTGWIAPIAKEQEARDIASQLGLRVSHCIFSPEEMAPRPGFNGPQAKRYRVCLVEQQYYHLDVLATSEQEAAQIATVSSEWWIDSGNGGAEVDFVEAIPAEDTSFSPPDATCKACGRTLTPEELCYEDQRCEDCPEHPEQH